MFEHDILIEKGNIYILCARFYFNYIKVFIYVVLCLDFNN